jgi:hypothetical protein
MGMNYCTCGTCKCNHFVTIRLLSETSDELAVDPLTIGEVSQRLTDINQYVNIQYISIIN